MNKEKVFKLLISLNEKQNGVFLSSRNFQKYRYKNYDNRYRSEKINEPLEIFSIKAYDVDNFFGNGTNLILNIYHKESYKDTYIDGEKKLLKRLYLRVITRTFDTNQWVPTKVEVQETIANYHCEFSTNSSSISIDLTNEDVIFIYNLLNSSKKTLLSNKLDEAIIHYSKN